MRNIILIEINRGLAILGLPPQATKSVAYSFTFGVSGNQGTVAWSLVGTLPAGLSFSAGTISGTPTSVGSFPIAVTAADSFRATTANYTLNVVSISLSIHATLPTVGLVGDTVSIPISQSGGVAPVTFAVTSGSLPAGLSINPLTGLISGTYTTAASYSYTITATDAASNTSPISGTTVISSPTFYILLENGNRMLDESGDLLLLEH